MNKKSLITMLLMLLVCFTASAQRVIDKLDRGLIAVKISSGVYVNWRIQSNEYYDVTYNLYRDGVKIAENLQVSNYKDAAGTTTSKYAVAAVVKGKEQAKCNAVSPWSQDYLEIKPKHDASLKSTYVPNDACCADVDGDGQVEILLKYDNASEMGQSYPKYGPKIDGVDTKEYSLFECLKLDGTVLWWVNCGPNMGDFQNNEQNIVAYDWDQDGKAEALFRAADGTTIHMADGTVYTVGDASKNYRAATGGGTNWFMHDGNEYLLYVNGATGKPYVDMAYPLKRLETGESSLEAAWGDGYGHRSSKYFFGAPYLDGRKPSIFLGRGIYTRHKFIAYDVDPVTHKLTERWRWYNNTNGPWKGQGYHNYAIVDVDMDGRDEIVWGSMVIDDNGKGLSTTGLGHGDAQHHGDLDPYTWGQEGFFCNEDKPGNNFRDLTTSKIYYRLSAGNDDGRSICGNFSNSYPGCQASSSRDYANAISTVTRAHLPIGTSGMAQNFRIYWDGDLCEETFNYVNGKNTEGAINKPGSGVIKTLTGSMTNNDTKGTPCYQGDILGDWREEVIMRTASNDIRIYTSTYSTQWRNYSLWYDHQYRNAMVWQMCGYNQPPHASYFLGEMEGITMAPPSLTMEGRKEIANGATISNNGEDIITCETNDMTVAVSEGATPNIYIDNAPSWVQGYAPQETAMANDPSKITYKYYTHTLTGGAFAGDMRLVKQGEGILALPKVSQKYTGKTEVWNGTLSFDGVMENSLVWLNRHTTLLTDGGEFKGGIEADYNATISPAGDGVKGSMKVGTLTLNMGAVLALDVYSEDNTNDIVDIQKLVINHHKDWEYGPARLTPVIKINAHLVEGQIILPEGKYLIGKLGEVEGELSDITIEGLNGAKGYLSLEDGNLYFNVAGMRDAGDVEWTGAESDVWDLASTKNFNNHGSADLFVSNDNVIFNDDAVKTTVTINEQLSPQAIIIDSSKDYTFNGTGSIVTGSLEKYGSGNLTINTDNTYTGGNLIDGGTVTVSKLSNSLDPKGNLGGVTTAVSQFVISNNGTLKTTAAVTNGSAIKVTGEDGSANGIIENTAKFTQQAALAGDTLVKKGAGEFYMESGTLSAKYITVKQGKFTSNSAYASKTVRLEGTSEAAGAGLTATAFNVPKGANARLTLTGNNYAVYSGALTGAGNITVIPTNTVNRVRVTGNWSKFEGTLKLTSDINFPFDNSYGLANATLDLATNVVVRNVAKTFAIGKLTGTGKLGEPNSNYQSQSAVSGSNTWKVGNSLDRLGDFAFSGEITDGGGSNKSHFEKVGTCKMTASKSWTNSGTVKVTAGELHLDSKVTLGTGALTVANGALLSGYSGTLATASAIKNLKTTPMTNSSITVNGSLYCYTSNAAAPGVAIWSFGDKPLTIGSTGTLIVGVNKCATAANPGCGTLMGDASDKSKLTINDGATIKVVLNYTPTFTDEAKADSFRIFFDFKNVTVGNVNYDLPDLPANYYWDTEKVKDGYLFVRYSETTGVAGIQSTEFVTVDVVNEAGVKVSQLHCTLAEVKQNFAKMSLPRGVYVLRMRGEKNGRGVMKFRK